MMYNQWKGLPWLLDKQTNDDIFLYIIGVGLELYVVLLGVLIAHAVDVVPDSRK